MQDQIQIDIQRLKAENERLRQQIEENEIRIRSLESMLSDERRPPPIQILNPEDDLPGEAWGPGEPPVPGAIPARTYRDSDGNIRILLCRTYAGEGWMYTPVADGWVTITRDEDQV